MFHLKARDAGLGSLAAAVALVALVFAVPAAADPPTALPFEFVFDDVNPCTADIHTVTIAGTTPFTSTTVASSLTAKGRLRRVRPGFSATAGTHTSSTARSRCSG